MEIITKRVYDKAEKSDGYRILVDRLWPRGIKKSDAHIDTWAKELAPSRDLLNWFHEEKEKRFPEFEKKYREELEQKKDVVKAVCVPGKQITLVTSVKDIEHSHIPVLKELFEKNTA
ncbi:MAG: hypothetical protein NMNS01_05250 [Nitrosomonas sp.]|nr:MAG: hypothetical protein NMNS01_05250 [Nitrosomonas sp.]